MMIYRGLGHELHRWDCVLLASIKLLKTPRVPTTQLPEQHNTTMAAWSNIAGYEDLIEI